MAAILMLLAFALAVLFHGFKFAPNTWLDWQGLMLIGFLLLALHVVLGGGFPFVIRRRE